MYDSTECCPTNPTLTQLEDQLASLHASLVSAPQAKKAVLHLKIAGLHQQIAHLYHALAEVKPPVTRPYSTNVMQSTSSVPEPTVPQRKRASSRPECHVISQDKMRDIVRTHFIDGLTLYFTQPHNPYTTKPCLVYDRDNEVMYYLHKNTTPYEIPITDDAHRRFQIKPTVYHALVAHGGLFLPSKKTIETMRVTATDIQQFVNHSATAENTASAQHEAASRPSGFAATVKPDHVKPCDDQDENELMFVMDSLDV